MLSRLMQSLTLKASPKRLAVCSNTNGFAVDTNGRVIRIDGNDSVGHLPLNQPCVLVSFDPDIFNYLTLVPFGATVSDQFRVHSDGIQWNQEVTGLHCDSQLQQVFVIQPSSVTAMDLSGEVSATFTADAGSLGVDPNAARPYLCAVAGNQDDIFVLDRSGPRVLLMSKRGLGDSRIISLVSEPLLIGSDLGSVAVAGDLVFLSDNRTGRVFKLHDGVTTMHSEALIGVAPGLCQIAADSRGRLIVSAFVSNSLTVLGIDGTVQQTLLGTEDGGAFHFPSGVAVLESEGAVSLLVVDYGRRRLLCVSASTAECSRPVGSVEAAVQENMSVGILRCGA